MVGNKTQWRGDGPKWRRLQVNRRYKDQLFRFLFREKKDLLELYNALNHTEHRDPDQLEIVTLEDVLFLKMKNDLSFVISGKLNLYEHQSTVNPNMPLRGLLYLARQYEGMAAVGKESIYGRRLLRLPTPEYVVFYNGSVQMEDQQELYLSDSYEGGRGSGCLECRCRVLNINRGHNSGVLNRCRRLWEYSEFTSEVNEWMRQGKTAKEAIELAINYCVEHGILVDILTKQRTEVLHMLLTEFDEKKYKRTIYGEGYEDGEKAGYSLGEKAGYSRGEQEGYNRGEQEGYSLGEQALLKSFVKKKLQKGKSIEQIAEELEYDIDRIQKLVEELEKPPL